MAHPDLPAGPRRGWAAYDPEWLVALARAQHPGEPSIAEALGRCRQAVGVGTALVHFASDRADDTTAGAIVETIELEDPRLGLVLVDVLQDGRIGGIEIASLLED